MSKQTDLLELRIKELEGQLHDEKRLTYVGETHSLHCENGELYIDYGTYPDDGRCLIMDTEQLFKDLPYIIEQVYKEQKKMQEQYLEEIKQSIATL